MFDDCYINEAMLICPFLSLLNSCSMAKVHYIDEIISSGVLIFMPDFIVWIWKDIYVYVLYDNCRNVDDI
jgi:hypothetical protein